MSDLAHELMDQFADATAVTGNAPPKRYLWTDAFAVCNDLGFYQTRGDSSCLQRAEALISQVHRVLGQHRPDDSRTGWISGLPEAEGELHPTAGGLRIGKTLNERSPGEPFDSQLEWDRDGQYFHYLTQWMHALHRASCVTANERELIWAAELSEAAHNGFTYEVSPGGAKRMFWKMSIDLSRPLVESMGHHDPLEGLLTSLELLTDERLTEEHHSRLTTAVGDFDQMCARRDWTTDDPLGIGGLLGAAIRLLRLVKTHSLERTSLLSKLLRDSVASLRAFFQVPPLARPAGFRLAFRELGLAIALRGFQMIESTESFDRTASELVRELQSYSALADEIETFWSNPDNRRVRTWSEHRDINSVMLATSLAPAGYWGSDKLR